MSRARLSLLYPATYLLGSGAALLLAPKTTLRVLQSNGRYDDIFPRVAGMFLVGLGMLVVHIMRHRLEKMYIATVVVRAFFCVCLVSFHLMSRDPFFLLVVIVVGIGIALTCVGIFTDAGRGPGRAA